MNFQLIRGIQLNSKDIISHLLSLEDDFLQNLKIKVDIFEYAEKLSRLSNMNAIKIDGQLVGLISYYTNSKEKCIYITHLGIALDWRKKKLASNLLKSIFSEKYSDKIRLEVYSGNSTALKLYEQTGFQKIHSADGFVSMERSILIR
jgi:ribosomal protein S18 acetylase RimI-like enzyme